MQVSQSQHKGMNVEEVEVGRRKFVVPNCTYGDALNTIKEKSKGLSYDTNV